MTKNEVGGVSAACTLGEIAAILCAEELEGFSGAELLTRAIANTPSNERRIRGMA